MNRGTYELHYYTNDDMPIIFHHDMVAAQKTVFIHWHKNMEFLYITSGTLKVNINFEPVYASIGDIVVIPSNAIHQIQTENDAVQYYCLIADYDFCNRFGVDCDTLSFDKVIHDSQASVEYNNIISEMTKKQPFYQTKVMSSVLSFFAILARSHSIPLLHLEGNEYNKQLSMVKKAFVYIDKNFDKKITTDTLADAVGFNKYYFCHVFKNITAMTPLNYINYVRCKKAYELLRTGEINAGEAAAQCGFWNFSHFSKTYKKFMGELPRESTKSKKTHPESV